VEIFVIKFWLMFSCFVCLFGSPASRSRFFASATGLSALFLAFRELERRRSYACEKENRLF
jgi:hypothetical protein